MIRRLLFMHLYLLIFTVTAVGDCTQTPPPANKSMPANISGGLLHFTQATSPDANYDPRYVLEVTNFELDTPRMSFVQYVGPAINSQLVCEHHKVSMQPWFFNQKDGCWYNEGGANIPGVWKPGNYCHLYVEWEIPTTKGGIPIQVTKVRVAVSAVREVKWNGKTLSLKQKVKAGVISF